MRSKQEASSTDMFPDPPMTATEGRRHRPSTKAKSTARGAKPPAKKAASKGSEGRALKHRVRVRTEDKREDPDEMSTSAKPKNLGAERDNKKRKGKATHALEAQAPGKRPSRKSTRKGANHVKPDSQQRRQHTRAVRSPKSRHAMAA